MKICVFGLNHLGCVTSACLADKGFDVVGLDPSKEVVESLNNGKSPIQEPFLDELINKNLNKNLKFTTDVREAIKEADIIWVTFDTPVDKNDVADYEYVKTQILSIFPYLNNKIVLISSQLPVGTTTELSEVFRKYFSTFYTTFAYSPENLRHGKAIEIFNNPERIVIGTNTKNNIDILNELFKSFNSRILWMSVESAEMTKHALNSFLAMEISFINEISLICEKSRANILDVENGLKTDSRVGKNAFLRAGEHYSGGTLARDVQYLTEISDDLLLRSSLIRSINESNNNHKEYRRNNVT